MNPPGSLATKYRRYRERFWVTLVFTLIVLFGFLEGWFFQIQSDIPLFGNILLFALINLNVILLLLLAYLVLRNIVKLIFDRKRNILGHKLRTRLVIAFVGLTLVPTLPLFWLATQFIFSSLDTWFSHRVEQSLDQSVKLARDYLDREENSLTFDCRMLKADLLKSAASGSEAPPPLEQVSDSLLELYRLDAIYLFDGRGTLLWQARSATLPPSVLDALQSTLLTEGQNGLQARPLTLESKQEALMIQVEFPTPAASAQQDTQGRLVVLRILPAHITEKLAAITAGYEDYLQLKMLQNPLKISHFITFSIVTLLVMFAAIWFGFFLAKNITVPIQALVSATRKVAEGDLTIELEPQRQDEIGMLIASFNKMVRDLREGREQLASAYQALQQSHTELEDRRRYMEIVLKNIAAGVVSLDAQGRIMTMNKSAEAIFGLQAEQTRGRLYSEFLQPAHMEVVKTFMNSYRLSRQPYLEQQVQVMLGNRPRVLLIKVSVLRDEDRFLGIVVVLDDLTNLEKAQRMAAWREVARRIAHEIKNPLTPIQLCAQRLQRKYPELLEDKGSILNECTQTIVQQVDHMKHLVNEFSKFARLPQIQPTACDLAAIVAESLALYRHTVPHVSLSLEKPEDLPLVQLDPNQFKQVMINLIENALHALGGERGSIAITLFHDPILRILRLECADTGHGLTPEDKLRMFEPYYSTKEKGTGLGLAIVASIVADHHGFLRVRDNAPRGTVIIIELPGEAKHRGR